MLMNPRARADAFFTARMAVQRAARLAEQAQRVEGLSLKGVRYDTPRVQTSGAGSPQLSWMCTVERVKESAAQATAEAETAQRKARLYLHGLPIPMALFCEAYYVLGLNLAEAAAIADRSERHCQRYIHELFTYDHSLPIEDPDKEDALEDPADWHDLPPERPKDAPRAGTRQPAIQAATGAHRAKRAQNSGLAAPQAQVGP